MLAFGNGNALGAGPLNLGAGELLATANETLTNALMISGVSTIAAAHGTTLNENASSMTIVGSSTLNFGALGEDGTILWHTPTTSNFSSPLPAINVHAGTLKGADSSFGFFLDDEAITVAAGATLDLAGNDASIHRSHGRRVSHRQRRSSDFDPRRRKFFRGDQRPAVARGRRHGGPERRTTPILGPQGSIPGTVSRSALAQPVRLARAPLAMPARSPSTPATQSRSRMRFPAPAL